MSIIYYPILNSGTGTPGTPSGSIQANNSGTFAGVLGSSVNFLTGAVSLVSLELTNFLAFGSDTGISRGGAGILDVGNGTAGDASGAVNVAKITLSGQFVDGSASPGTSGYLLSTTGSATAWVSASSVTPSFSSITTGTNTAATMTVGTGAAITSSGSGVINSTELGGKTFAAPAAIGSGTPAAGTFTTLTANTNLVVNGGTALTTTNQTGTGAIVLAGSPTFTGTVTIPTLLLSNPLAVLQGGTGTTTPALVAGTNITITGTWPNQTINATGGGSGTVNSGTSSQLAYYASTGTAVSGDADATISAGALTLGIAGTVAGSLILAQGATNSDTVTISASKATASWTINLPATAGTNLYFLQTDGSGNTTWAAGAGGFTIEVGGSSVSTSTVNFSNTTPAAAMGYQNVGWQNDALSPPNISAYLPLYSDNVFSPSADPAAAVADSATLNDEFNGSSLNAKWTAVNSGNLSTATVTNSTFQVTVAALSAAINGYIQSYAPGASNFTFEAKMLLSNLVWNTGSSAAGFPLAGLIVTDGTKYLTAMIGIPASNTTGTLHAEYWTNSTTFNTATTQSLTLPNFTTVSQGFPYLLPLWVRLQKSSTNLILSWSANGYDWQSLTATNYFSNLSTISGIGIAATNNNDAAITPRWFYFRQIA